ncbi:amidohydrolase family protein [Bradyrhizobium sp. AUGA SZCCT0176]|uniref:amidohydrolase family protein n=1 Tax=unclassified Bradyrhizobium TaxID=2631580 RepID=UPI001BA834EC|nr:MULTISPECIES: amidohydrolase family protein [unclassified Bradyrhizobium]MBR1225015.1 amidohydrolase family protein [Bradyrhizobium sp. AUGA SZCCT0176]MBR1281704.1 amidohydrolase family protein [Bradyrhizobium sp. AUGA SZCCT0177]
MPSYLPFDPNPRRPLRLPPPKSIDSQFHVLGPVEKYPIRAGAAYQMPSATWEAALRVHKALGIERGIIVQTTTYGADHSVVLDGLAAMGSNYRACANALVFAEADDSYLARLDAAGVGGARFSFRKELGAVLSDKDFERAIARIRELGWYAKFQPEKDGIVGNLDKIRGLNVPVLIDHMGRPDPLRGKDDPNLRAVLDLLSKGNFWVMLSLGEKTSKAGPPWDDVIPIARAYIEAAPDRCVWASDWPHPVSVVQPPNDADLLELLYRYAPDEAELEKILVTNPARLFGFPD